MSTIQARADALARLADPGLGLDLPAALAKAITAYAAIMALRPAEPPPPARAAITAEASRALGAAFAKGSTTVTIDPGPVAAARLAEAEHRDQAEILHALRELAPARLCQITDEHRAHVIAALQRKHADIIGQLVPAARRLPPGITETAALDQGGQVRTGFILTRDLAGAAERLRAVLVDVQDVPLRGEMPGSLEISLAYVTDTTVYDRATGHYGPPGTPAFYRALARDADAGLWWLPTVRERESRAAQIVEERKLAAVADLPRGARVF
jgi:hypothetical protein